MTPSVVKGWSHFSTKSFFLYTGRPFSSSPCIKLLLRFKIASVLREKRDYFKIALSAYGGLVAKSHLTLATPRTVACQAPLSFWFCRWEYYSGLPFPSLRDLPDPGIEPWSPALQADSLATELQGSPNATTKSLMYHNIGGHFSLARKLFSRLLWCTKSPLPTSAQC